MTRRLAAWTGVFAVIVILMVFFGWKFKPSLSVSAPNLGDPFHLHAESGLLTWIPYRQYPQLSLKKMSVEEATKKYVELLNQDHSYDWKVALSFYGKVIDESGQPVSGTSVAFDWNTTGVPGGTAGAITMSDEKGLFSLTGQHGKILGVYLRKEGYYAVEGSIGGVYFEYANPSDPHWYEPDANNPIVFHLRKMGLGAKLFTKSFTVPMNNSHPQSRINLMQGFIKPDGMLIISRDTSKFLPGAQPFPWSFSLSMTEGGLIETNEQFPFLAPESGYVPKITITETNLDPSVYRGGFTKTYYFYLPSTNTYGRLTVNASTSLSPEINFAYNLTRGERILEPTSHVVH